MARAQDKTVLVVEDEPDVQLFLQTVLEDAGFKVLTASDGEVAWQVITEERPDFISLDLILPKKTGHRLLRDLRKDKELSKIPVLIVTAHADDELGRSGPEGVLDGILAEGAGRFLRKPVSPIDYVRCIEEALGVEEIEELEDRLAIKNQMEHLMRSASPEVLRSALDALRKG
jgi:CheY-like chemotaxis protein